MLLGCFRFCIFKYLIYLFKYSYFKTLFIKGNFIYRLQNSHFRKAQSTVSGILACEAREPHMAVGRVRRESASPHSPSLFSHSL